MYFQTVQKDDWPAVRRNFQKLESNLFGPVAEPTFNGLTLSGISDTEILYSNNGILASDSTFTLNNSTKLVTASGLLLTGSQTYGINLSGGTWSSGDLNLSANPMIRADGERVIHFNHGQKGCFVGEDTTDGDIGDENTFIGYHAGKNNDATTIPIAEATGERNVYVGARSGRGDTDGSDISGSENVGIGAETLRYCTTGYENTCVGDEAGKGITTAHGSVAIGNDAMQGGNGGLIAVTGNFNTAVGTDTLYVVQDGGYNVAVGYQCLFTTTDDDYNVGVGYQSLFTCNGGENNITFGYRAAYSLTTGDRNFCVGPDSGYSLTEGSDNVFFGYQAGYNQTTSNNDLLIGYQAGFNANGVTTGDQYNSFIGYQSFYNDNGSFNLGYGYQSGYNNDTTGAGAEGAYNVYIGYESGYGKTNGFNNTGLYNVGLGADTLEYNTSGSYNTGIGASSLTNNTSGERNIGVGYATLFVNLTGNRNLAVGYQVLYGNTIGTENACVGYQTMFNNTEGGHNTAVGSIALFSNTTASYSTAVGYASLFFSTGARNTGVGAWTLYDCTIGTRNTGIAYQALQNVTAGNYNIGIGYEAGGVFTTGSSNIMIGYQVGKSANGIISAATDSNLLAIGNQDPVTNLPLIEGYFAAHASGPKLFINGACDIGDGTNQTAIEADGTVRFDGTATVWDDYVTPLGPNNWNGVANNPTLTKLFDDGAGSTGVYGYVWADGDEALITIQMPHRWKEGTTIQPHIHFMCTSDVDPADNFGIEFEWVWADISEDFPANSTLQTNDISTGVNTNNMHQLANITSAGIGGSGHTISSVLLCRIKRVAATVNNYAGGIAILDFDVHYEIDTVGSRQINTK